MSVLHRLIALALEEDDLGAHGDVTSAATVPAEAAAVADPVARAPGVDALAVGAVTHSAAGLDFGPDFRSG